MNLVSALNIKEFIESGVLELYALDLLKGKEKAEVERVIDAHPEAREELNNIQRAIETYAAAEAISPPPSMKDKIRGAISNLEKEDLMHFNDLPLISRFSDHNKWLSLVKDLIPDKLENGKFFKVLSQSETLVQMLLVSSTEFEDEIHDDLHESFLILEGQCKCTVEQEVYFMKAGEYTEIPLHAIHKVEMVTPRVVAILQRLAV